MGLGIVKTTSFTPAPVLGGFLDPQVQAELAQRDWLWTGNFRMPPNSFANAYVHRVPLDITVQRRLKQEEIVQVVATRGADGGAGDVIIDIDVRILIIIRI